MGILCATWPYRIAIDIDSIRKHAAVLILAMLLILIVETALNDKLIARICCEY